MKKLFTLLMVAAALIGFNANAACYIIGAGVSGQSWGGNVGTALTATSTNVYEGELTFTAGGYFGIATQLGSNSNDWTTLNNNRYGASTNGKQLNYGEATSMIKTENCFVNVTAGTYKIVVDFDNMKVTLGEKPTGVVDLYFRGPIAGSDWPASSAYQFKSTQTDNVVELTGVTVQGRFDIASADWSTKYAAASDNNHIVTGGTAFTTTSGGNVDLALDATYTNATITLNTQTGALTVTGTKTTESGIYLRGAENSWGAEAAYQFEDQGDGVFVLEKAVEAGKEFKVADANWGTINYGGSNLTVNTEVALEYNGNNLTIPSGYDIESVTVKLQGDGKNTIYVKTQSETPTLPSSLYVVGTPNEWNISESDIVLAGNDGVYTGTVTLTGGDQQQFRFYGALGNWDDSSYGSAVDDGDNHAVEFTNGTYTGAVVSGKGNWVFANLTGELGVSVDLNQNTVTFDGSNLEEEQPEITALYLADWSGAETVFRPFTLVSGGIFSLEIAALPEEFKITSQPDWNGVDWGGGYWIQEGNLEYTNIPQGGDNMQNKLPENFTLTSLQATVNLDGTLNLTAVGESVVEPTTYYLAAGFGQDEEPTFAAFVAGQNEGEYVLGVDGALPEEFKITTSTTWEGRDWGSGYWIEGNTQYNNIPQGGDNMVNKLGDGFMATQIVISENQDGTLNLIVEGQAIVEPTTYYLAAGFGEEEEPTFVEFVAGQNEGEYVLGVDGALPAEFKITTSTTWEGRDWGAGYWIYGNTQYENIPQGGANMVNKLEDFLASEIVISENQDGTLNLKVNGTFSVDAFYLADWETTEGQTIFHKIEKQQDGTYHLDFEEGFALPSEFKILNQAGWDGATQWCSGYWLELGNEPYTIPDGDGDNIQNKLGEAFTPTGITIEQVDGLNAIALTIDGTYDLSDYTYYIWAWNEGEEGAWIELAPVAGEDNLFEAAIATVPDHIIITDNNEWTEGAPRWAYSPEIDNTDVWYFCGLSEGDGSTTIAIEEENVTKIQLRYGGVEKVLVQFVTETRIKGDINGDGSVDGSDVSALLEMVLEGGLTDAQKEVADLTGDGDVDGSDISALLELVLGGE